ncbi:related to endoglucanase 1 precursor (egl1) [Melanopsichium pennsylvanicum]|uniref:Cellulase n=2 Tax=Melanopsichium pennsylvanicum TaxID=63383 RepID=A0AAJ5C5B4_9BASI|nr:endoglucanase 1 precursor (egl1) [Melanopsichium pennsylvanicum 4]SNX84557.1 related to endoglucanase 1 precursor (egl1) [Melanopsichium pennsylvanicum]
MAFKLYFGFLALSFSLSLVHLDGVSAGMATRYWDCCKPSASWGKKAHVYSPVDTCKADGVTLIDPSTADSGQSGCTGGDQFMCSCQQPFNDETDPTLALGFAAFSTGSEESTDCACYFAEFSNDEQGQPMKRNKLIFQVTNTGGDVQSQNIDFQIPGGGLGAFAQGCPAQWKTPAQQWGETFGGLKDTSGCSNLPEPLQEGCKWRFTSWGSNPVLKGSPQRVQCPKSLIDRSGCQRKDEKSVQPYRGQTDKGNTAAPDGYKRDRSVCLFGAKKGGQGQPGEYAPTKGGAGGSSSRSTSGISGDSGSSTPPTTSVGSVSGRDGSTGSTAPGAGKGVDALQGSSANTPSHKHKMQKVCKKWH